MQLRYNLPAAVLIIGLGISPSQAEVTLIETFKSEFFIQTSDLGPPVPEDYSFVPRLTVSDPADVANVSVVTPKNTLDLSSSDGLTYSVDQGPYVTKAALDFSYPNSTYTFLVSGGALGSQSGSLTIGPDAYPGAVPQFTGGTFSLLQNLNVFQANLLTWDGYQSTSAANTPLTFLTIFDQTGAVAYANQGTNLFADDLLPAGTLLPSSTYTVDLTFSNRQIDSISGFGGSESSVAFDLRTSFSFTTAVAEPSSLAITALGGLALLACWRRRQPRGASKVSQASLDV